MSINVKFRSLKQLTETVHVLKGVVLSMLWSGDFIHEETFHGETGQLGFINNVSISAVVCADDVYEEVSKFIKIISMAKKNSNAIYSK